MTPTTVWLSPFRVRARPMTPGSDPKRRCHNEWLRRTTCVPGLSSFGTNVRPSRADTPNNSKRFAETRRPSSRSGSPTPVRLKLRSDIAAMPMKLVACFCQSRKLAGDGVSLGKPRCAAFSHNTVSYTHLRAHETPEHLVCRLLL